MGKTWAIIGGGNGGQTIAAHLGIIGKKSACLMGCRER